MAIVKDKVDVLEEQIATAMSNSEDEKVSDL